jgi:hypothetical protein
MTRAAAGAAAAAVLLSGLKVVAFGDETTAPAPAGAAGTASGAPPSSAPYGVLPGKALPPMGAFTDSGAEGVQSLAALQKWLGGTDIRVGHTYLPGDSWDAIEGDTGLLRPWADWRRADHSRMLVLNVPMQEHNEDRLSDYEVRGLIQQGASGEDDEHFTRLARRLVSLGVPDTVIVLGWEMNGTTYAHRCGPDPEGWKAYWNRIVAAMRAVPGQHFRFDFAPNRGQDAIAWTECYPGDASVDIVGMDSYDQPPGESFFDQVTEPYGLQAQVTFAARHHKPISYPEWGLFRNGDNPDYMSLMLAWIARHRPVYQTLTDYCPHGVLECTDNPKATAVYRALLYGRKVAPVLPVLPAVPATPKPTPTHTPTPAPTASVPGTPAGTPTVKPTVKPTATPPAKPPVQGLAPTATPTAVPLPTTLPTPAATTGAVTARPAPAPAAATVESCAPLPLSDELKKSYDDAQVCVKLRPKSGARGKA